MVNAQSASTRFEQLDSLRSGYIRRAERHAGWTLRRLCLPKNFDNDSDTIQNDWQSVGAQGTNHLSNKLMLTMFAPSRPFIRYGFNDKAIAKFKEKLGLDPQQVEEYCAEQERKAVKELDKRPVRPTLFDVLARLVVIGDALMYLPDKDEPAATFDIRDYVQLRAPSGKMSELIVRERVNYVDLTPDARAAYTHGTNVAKDDNDVVNLYRWVRRIEGGQYEETQWVEGEQLTDPKYTGTYSEADCPWHSFAWHLPRGAHYGTGHVEEYAGSFAALSALSRAEVEGALLASEYRWLVNPGGVTKVDDVLNSRNGAAIPGLPNDVQLLNNSKPGDLAVVNKAIDGHVRVLGRAFLMPSAVTRDAERVTTEELHQQAMELETGLGGIYTRLSSTVQYVVGYWLTKKVGLDISEAGLNLSIVTGLDALSRNGDLAALRAALSDITGLQNLGVAVGDLHLNTIISDIFMGHGLNPSKYVKTADEKKADQQAAEAAQARAVQTEANAKAGAQQ